MTCEACGGDGQIEVGAYRGDDSPDTRECRLCGGVVTATLSSSETVGTAFSRLGQAATKAGTEISQLVHLSSHSGSRTPDIDYKGFLNTDPRPWKPEDVAREYAERLNADNERRQREAEARSRSADDAMNDFLRARFKS